MDDFIKAKQILSKYGDVEISTIRTDDDVLLLHINIKCSCEVSKDDETSLNSLNFYQDNYDGFISFRFGSA